MGWNVRNLIKNICDDGIGSRDVSEPIAMDFDPAKLVTGEHWIGSRVAEGYFRTLRDLHDSYLIRRKQFCRRGWARRAVGQGLEIATDNPAILIARGRGYANRQASLRRATLFGTP